ncbi:MAG: formylmethanofuran dehydrogenase subunit C [Gemmatales bacterium]|nr:formylmethanofuran dehydrogenase subunit C [Gemmatales bacterium]MDW8385879.1 formylmethanofuran dehydrogenase subunit C [Gemmatales bacterium]
MLAMLTLTYRSDTNIPIEAEVIRPDHLAGKSAAEIARLLVQHGNRQELLGEFFEVQGDASDEHIRVVGDCRRVKLIGAGMQRGSIVVEGSVGMHLGAEMVGGSIEVHGDAGDWVGAEMRGGMIRVRGNAGHLVGAAYRGSRRGMRGGVILIHGNAGNEVGGTMRRGLIAVAGSVADFAGVDMIAGTICILGSVGIRTGAGMKRGSIVLGSVEMPSLLPTFRRSCVYRPQFLDIYLRTLKRWDFPIEDRHLSGQYVRWCGDLVALGKGEILHWSGN